MAATWQPPVSDGFSLRVSYEDLVDHPIEEIERVIRFIRPNTKPDRDKIASVVSNRQVGRKHDVKRQFRYYDPQWTALIEAELADYLDIAKLNRLE